ncbi:MAG: DUF2283 domain-containing protein [Ignavibacteria bacterium]|nr:DUF2283 domain-containing protein [Ignavibacteria bacterium]
MKIYYDSVVDALYIELRPLKEGTAVSKDLNDEITGNFGPDGKIAGLEILDASKILGNNLFNISFEIPQTAVRINNP